MNEKITKTLYKLMQKAYNKGEIPVAALIIKDDKIISKGYNKRNKKQNPLLHAEIIAIYKASKKLKSWKLNDCELYVSLEPCHMCKEVIKECRIKKVVYFADKTKKINYKTNFVKEKNDYNFKYSELLTNFFKKLR